MAGRWLIGGIEKRCAEQFITVESKQSSDDEAEPETSSTANTASSGAVRGDQSYTRILENSFYPGLGLYLVNQRTAMCWTCKEGLKGAD
jgi:hypothetical protein